MFQWGRNNERNCSSFLIPVFVLSLRGFKPFVILLIIQVLETNETPPPNTFQGKIVMVHAHLNVEFLSSANALHSR